jgi:hypothetical protein
MGAVSSNNAPDLGQGLKGMKTFVAAMVCYGFLFAGMGSAEPAKKSPREALQVFGDLIGTWRGTGIPYGTKEEQQKGFWTEYPSWEWKFKGPDAWLEVVIKDGKYYTAGELRYVPDKDHFTLQIKTTNKETHSFTGRLNKERVLTLEREDKKETQRLVVTLLHHNRILYRYEVKPEGKATFTKKYYVGAIKEGESFASGDGKPECIVSGGLGTSTVTYKGQTYYVCCSGCRSEFNENPEKYIKEYLAKKAKKK